MKAYNHAAAVARKQAAVAKIQAVVQKIQAVALKPRKIMLTTSAGRDCNVAGQAS